MISQNIFASDEFKKQILQSEGLKDADSKMDYTIAEPVDSDEIVMGNIISKTPKIPGQVKNIIQDASILARADKEAKATELNSALNNVMTKYNREYGLDLKIDFSNMSKTLVAVSDPKSRRTLELYLSEVFQSVRPILILQMISKLSLIIDYVMDPQRLFGDSSMSLSDLWICIEKILQYTQALEDMKDEILIKGADLELKKLGEESKSDSGSLDGFDSEAVRDFMNLFNKEQNNNDL